MSPSDGDRLSWVALFGTSAATEVSLIDSSFRTVARSLASLRRQVPAGIYKARFQLGSTIDDVPFELISGKTSFIDGPQQIAISAAPLPRTRLAGSMTEGRLSDFLDLEADHDGPTVHVLLRGGDQRSREMTKVQVHGPGEPTSEPILCRDLANAREIRFQLRPGIHELTVISGDEGLCRAIPIAAGLGTVVSMELPPPGGSPGRAPDRLSESSLLMFELPCRVDERCAPLRPGTGEIRRARFELLAPGPWYDDLLIQDMAQQALGQSRALLDPADVLERALSPLALLLAAHGLIEARRARMAHPLDPLELPPDESEAVRWAYQKLKESHLGDTADVAALGLVTGQPTPPANLDVPPLLASTWRTLVSVSQSHADAVVGETGALEIAERIVPCAPWLIWSEQRRRRGQDLSAGARAILEPALRPSPGRLPSWVETRELDQLTKANARTVARGLELPIPLVLQLAQNLEEERLTRRRRRHLRRIEALENPRARVCLIVRPDGAHIQPRQGRRISLARDFYELVDGVVMQVALDLNLVEVRAPPVDVDSDEMREAIARADVMLADASNDDPAANAILRAWVSSHPESSLVDLSKGPATRQWNSHELGSRLFEAARSAPPRAPSPERSAWLRTLAQVERRCLELQDIAVRQDDLTPARIRLAFPSHVLRGEASSVQREVFLLFRAFGDWRSMLRTERVMTPALRRTVLVREQVALALKWSENPRLQDKAVRLLESVIAEIDLNGETCGLLGGVFKKRWLQAKHSSPPDAPRWLDEAIRRYREGSKSSPEDPYPRVNLLTLLAAKGTAEALQEHAQLLPGVEEAATRQMFQRPTFWELVSMMELAANKREQKTCDRYRRMALAAPHEPWQRETAAVNLCLLRESPAPQFQGVAPWLDGVIAALR